jgi:hypothetical protein
MVSTKPFNPLIWWVEHEQQFLNIGFFARQMMGIVGSQFEIK